MITTQEEAITHANHAHLGRFKYVVVEPDGSIHASNDSEKITAMIGSNTFIVKGDLKKNKPKASKKNFEITE